MEVAASGEETVLEVEAWAILEPDPDAPAPLDEGYRAAFRPPLSWIDISRTR
jgi:hypothetical protein